MISEPVVVLGGAGFVGSHLVARLVAMGLDTHAVDVAFPDERRGRLEGARVVGASLAVEAEMRNVVRGAGTVLHLAADMGGVGYFHSDADLGAAMRNGRLTLNALEASIDAGVERFVYTASACVYPIERAGEELSEDMIGTGTPDALYGAEKLQGLRLCSKVPAARVVVLDTVYGPGAEREGPRAKFPASVAWKALRARETGRLELWGDGSQVRSYLYVDDAVERILTVAAGPDHGPVNVTGSRPATCRQIAETCLELANAEAEVVTNAGGPTGVPARTCSGARYALLYGQPGELGYEVGFERLIRWLDR